MFENLPKGNRDLVPFARKHIVYERMRVDETGNVQREVITRACTPSDRRSNSNMLADRNLGTQRVPCNCM